MKRRRSERLPVRFLVEDGGVIAYFPTLFHSHDYENSMHLCYSHLGQHSPCSPWYARLLRPATRREYASLLHELHAIGFGSLKPERIKPYPQHARGWAFA